MQEWSQYMDTGTERFLRGDFPGAEKGFRAALQEAKEILEPTDDRFLLNLSMLAMVLSLQGRYLEAEPLYQRQLAIRDGLATTDTSDMAECLEGYAQALRETGRVAEAEEMVLRAGKIRQRLAAGEGSNG